MSSLKGPTQSERADHPRLSVILLGYRAHLPLIMLVGLAAGLLEGVGIGLLIPLIAVLLAGTSPQGLPVPIVELAAIVAPFSVATRIVLLGVIIVLLVSVKGLLQAAANVLASRVDLLIARDVRDALLKRAIDLEYAFYLRNDHARVVQILTQDRWALSEGVHQALWVVPAISTLAAYAVLLAWLDWRLLSLVIVMGLVVVALVRWFERRQRHLSFQLTAHGHVLGELLMSVLNGFKVILLFGQRRREQKEFAAVSEEQRRKELKLRNVSAFAAPVIDSTISIIFVVVLVSSHVLAVPVPQISAFLLILLRAQTQASSVCQALIGIATVRGSIREIDWLLAQEDVRREVCPQPAPPVINRSIKFDHVGFAYPDGTQALSDVSTIIEHGKVTALIGRSGAGKSSFVSLLCRLVEPQSGQILLGDEPTNQFDLVDWLSCIAVAGQSIDLMPRTVAQNIAYGQPAASQEDIDAAAIAAGAADFVRELPLGYDTRIDQDGTNLSAGQRQRLGLARALLIRPDLLILDEATSAVDTMSESEIMQLFAERRFFRTALVISHRRSTLAACDNGIVIDHGRIVEYGELRSLEYYRAMGELGR